VGKGIITRTQRKALRRKRFSANVLDGGGGGVGPIKGRKGSMFLFLGTAGMGKVEQSKKK